MSSLQTAYITDNTQKYSERPIEGGSPKYHASKSVCSDSSVESVASVAIDTGKAKKGVSELSFIKAPQERPSEFTGAMTSDNEVRKGIGGKGLFLTKMQKAGLPVPPFEALDTVVLSAFEEHPISIDLLKQYLAGIENAGRSPMSIARVKEEIGRLRPYEKEKRDQWLRGLNELIISDGFYQQIAPIPESDTVRNLYAQLQRNLPSDTAFIVRSSGVKEDGYGDAQAGKYDSHVHGEGDILKTCLSVMASGYRPEVCPEGVPHPMAMIIQACIDCRFGGVAISHTSLQDDTIQVEYVPGQPKGAVAGQFGVTPHRYDIGRSGINPEFKWTQGNVPDHFVLEKSGSGFTEKRVEQTTSTPLHEELPPEVLKTLHHHIERLENMLGCPVDVEFAIDQNETLYLVQV